MKAIETEYAGCRFRSRLEARWAVVFDHLGYEWSYEMEGFDLKSGRYLPDFYLPRQRKWVEIKGPSPSSHDMERAWEFGDFAESRGERFAILVGDIPKPVLRICNESIGLAMGVMQLQFIRAASPEELIGQVKQEWYEAPSKSFRTASEEWAYLMIAQQGEWLSRPYGFIPGVWVPTTSPAVTASAFRAGRLARFEYGETPIPTNA